MADVAAQIRRLQQQIANYTNQLNACITRAGTNRKKIKELEKRLDQLRDIRQQATDKLNGFSDDAHDAQNKLSKELGNAIWKSVHTDELRSQIARDLEPTFSSDARGWESVANIDREIAKVQREIDDLKRQADRDERSATSYRKSINTANKNIKSLQKQAAKG